MGAGAVAVARASARPSSCTRLPEAGGTVTDYDLRGGVPKVVRRYPWTINQLPTALVNTWQRRRRCDHSVIFRGMPGLCRALDETAPRGAYPLKTVFRMRRIRLRIQDAKRVPVTSIRASGCVGEFRQRLSMSSDNTRNQHGNRNVGEFREHPPVTRRDCGPSPTVAIVRKVIVYRAACRGTAARRACARRSAGRARP